MATIDYRNPNTLTHKGTNNQKNYVNQSNETKNRLNLPCTSTYTEIKGYMDDATRDRERRKKE